MAANILAYADDIVSLAPFWHAMQELVLAVFCFFLFYGYLRPESNKHVML